MLVRSRNNNLEDQLRVLLANSGQFPGEVTHVLVFELRSWVLWRVHMIMRRPYSRTATRRLAGQIGKSLITRLSWFRRRGLQHLPRPA